MADTTSAAPSDAEVDALYRSTFLAMPNVARQPPQTVPPMVREFARAVLAKWGASQPVAREPLTEDAIVDAFCVTPGLSPRQMVGCFLAGARFAERAHGITGDSNG